MSTIGDPLRVMSPPHEVTEKWRQEHLHLGISLGHALVQGARLHGDATMVFSSQQRASVTTTIGAIVAEGWEIARRWAGLGVDHHDIVAIQAPNWEETAISYAATALLGATLLPIVAMYGPSEIGFILRQSRAKVLVAPASWRGVELADRLRQAGPLPDLEHVIVFGDSAPPGGVTWAEVAQMSPAEPRRRPNDGEGLAALVYTSGTTGNPKGVCHTSNSLLAELRHNPTPPRDRGTVSLQPFPAGHTAGLSAILGPAIHGVDTILMDAWSPDVAADLVVRYGVNAMAGTPFHILGLLDQIGGRPEGATIEQVITGGAGVPVSLVEDAEAVGWKVSRCYGATELPSATWSPASDPLERRARTDGRPMGGNEIRVVDLDGLDVTVGTEGEVLLRGPEQFAGYFDAALDLDVAAGDGWFRTGDIGAVDREGYLTITDRLKDIIIRGGENISSVEVESVLRQHPDVAEVAVVPSPDPRYGERVCAFVVVRPGKALSLQELKRHFSAAGIAKHKTPERLELVEDLPRTAAGKIRKSELREQLRARGRTR
jgi:acyl-CoA synthetase (AMP-forming)/AMP-acid ligase II